jgi:acyl-CoA synthetase (AMP-forming)/AMP-acid ligase II
MDEGGNLLAPGQTGEVVVRGACVMAGYEGSASDGEEFFPGNWFRTGDQGFLDADGYLFLTGRLKEIINREVKRLRRARWTRHSWTTQLWSKL